MAGEFDLLLTQKVDRLLEVQAAQGAIIPRIESSLQVVGTKMDSLNSTINLNTAAIDAVQAAQHVDEGRLQRHIDNPVHDPPPPLGPVLEAISGLKDRFEDHISHPSPNAAPIPVKTTLSWAGTLQHVATAIIAVVTLLAALVGADAAGIPGPLK